MLEHCNVSSVKTSKEKPLLKITGDLAMEQITMQSLCDSKIQYLTCEVLTFTLKCASKSHSNMFGNKIPFRIL